MSKTKKKPKMDDYLEENIAYTVIEDSAQNVSSSVFDLDELMKNFDSEYTKQTGNDLLFAEISNYDLNFNMKQIIIICNYYNIVCNKKMWKKIDYIKAILEFEHNTENYETVLRRKQMWFYMEELKTDKFMKQFILFL